jgi:hypothetical protein
MVCQWRSMRREIPVACLKFICGQYRAMSRDSGKHESHLRDVYKETPHANALPRREGTIRREECPVCVEATGRRLGGSGLSESWFFRAQRL